MEKNYKMVAKTFFGFEDILAVDLRNLGAMHVTKTYPLFLHPQRKRVLPQTLRL